MKKLLTLLTIGLLTFVSFAANANGRVGGSKNVGQQSTNVTNKQATAAKPAVTPTPATTGAPVSRSWGSMLGGIAAGLGLAWLASNLGLDLSYMVLLLGLLATGILASLVVLHIYKHNNDPVPRKPNHERT